MSKRTLADLEVGLLHAREGNPRFDLGGLESLTASIKETGIIQPLTVTADNEGYLILAGHRRHAAAQAAGLTTVPCVIVESNDAHAATVAVHENTQRHGLSAAETARGIQGMLDAGVQVRTIAKGLGATQKEVKTLAAASKGTDEAISLLHTGALTLEHSIELSDLAQSHPEIYDATMADLAQSNNASWVMNRARQSVATAIARVEAEALADATGATVLDEHPGYDPNVARLGDDHDHAGQDCYALLPSYDRDWDDDRTVTLTPKVVHFCINARTHTKNADSAPEAAAEDEARKAERRRVIANNKAWAQANDIRAAWIADHLQARTAIPKKHLSDILALNLAHPYSDQHVRSAVRIVAGIETSGWPGESDYAKATAGEAVRVRTHLLATVAAFEDGMSKTVWREHRASFASYLMLLEDLGYTLTPPEAAYVTAIDTDNDPANTTYDQ